MLNRTQRTALRPMHVMAESIADLRASGQHELADALTRLREDWARAAARYPHKHVLLRPPPVCLDPHCFDDTPHAEHRA